MAHEGVYATLAEYAAKCGANVHSNTQVEAWVNQVLAEAEAIINVMCREVFAVDAAAFAALNANKRHILTGITTDLASITAITYDMSGFTSRVEAEDMINVRRDSAIRGLSMLRDKEVRRFLAAV